MKLLVVSSRPPWPPTMADAMTVDRLVRFLVDRGHAVDLACFVEGAGDERELREGLGPSAGASRRFGCPAGAPTRVPRSRFPGPCPCRCSTTARAEMSARIEALVAAEGYDLVYTHLIRMAEYTRRLPIPKVMGMQISQALNLGRMVEHAADPLRKLFYRIEAAKVRPYEVAVRADFDRVFLCGPSDIEAIERTAPRAERGRLPPRPGRAAPRRACAPPSASPAPS